MSVQLGERAPYRSSATIDNDVQIAALAAGGAQPAPRLPGSTPVLPERRRSRSRNTRRPPSGLVPATYALAGGAGCDDAVALPRERPYRMARGARLAITLTVLAAVLVVGLGAILSSGGPTGTTQVTVGAGDTLWAIAQRVAPDDEVWSVIDQITELNSLSSSALRPGQVLEVPVG